MVTSLFDETLYDFISFFILDLIYKLYYKLYNITSDFEKN